MTNKQKRFISEYLRDLNATRAAIRAGYSERTAQEQASRLLANDVVRRIIAEKTVKHIRDLDVSARHVLYELAKMAFADVADLVETGFRYNDKIKSLELLGRYLRLFTDKVGHDLSEDLKEPEPEPKVDLSKLTDEEFRQFSKLLDKCSRQPPRDIPVDGGLR